MFVSIRPFVIVSYAIAIAIAIALAPPPSINEVVNRFLWRQLNGRLLLFPLVNFDICLTATPSRAQCVNRESDGTETDCSTLSAVSRLSLIYNP